MGSGSSYKPAGKPQAAEATGGGLAIPLKPNATEERDEVLQITLTNVNPRVHAQTSRGDSLSLQDTGSAYEVHVDAGRLGDVPPGSYKAVRAFGPRRGAILSLDAGGAVIQLAR